MAINQSKQLVEAANACPAVARSLTSQIL